MVPLTQLSEMNLKSKFTFIDVEEHVPAVRRFASMPGNLSGLQSSSSVFEAFEDEYLAGLLQEARMSPVAFVAESTESLESTESSRDTAPSLAEEAQKDTEAAEDAAEDVALSDADVAGSLGHPHFCRRPCVLLALRHCPHGVACKYCHHFHGQQSSISKHNREKLSRKSAHSMLHLLRGSLRQKMEQVPELVSQVSGLLDIIEGELQNYIPEAGDSETTIGTRLQDKVAAMSVASMLGNTFTGRFEPAFRARLQGELQRLRRQSAEPPDSAA